MNLQLSLEDGRWWTTSVNLPSWKGFQSRHGAYGAQDANGLSDGNIPLVFAPEGREGEPLTPSEMALIVWTIENEAALSKAVIASILKEYPNLQKEYGYSEQERAERMPNVASADGLRALIGLSAINIHQIQKNGIPYVGFEFGCIWDEEHGLGVLMHNTRTVEIGEPIRHSFFG